MRPGAHTARTEAGGCLAGAHPSPDGRAPMDELRWVRLEGRAPMGEARWVRLDGRAPMGESYSSSKAACRARTASSTTSARTMHEILIDDVEIISMLML